MLPSGASWRDFLCTLKHVIVQQGEGPEAPAHEQHVLLVQCLLWDLQLSCTDTKQSAWYCSPLTVQIYICVKCSSSFCLR